MQTHELLTAARELIKTPDKWVQGFFGFDTDGRDLIRIEVADPQRTPKCLCSHGALIRIAPHDHRQALEALNLAANLIDPDMNNIVEFNDNHSHAEVMAVWEKAIAAAA